jgi:putative ABC transport system permease protein
VVGVVGDVRQTDRAGAITPTMYMPTTWSMLSTMTLALRTKGDPAASIGAVREAAARVIPEYPLFDVDTMDSVAAANVAEPRAQTAVVTLFGLVSLLLASLGIAGVTAFLVARRTPELAVRIALGASGGRVVRYVLARGGVLCLAGVALGTLLVAAFVRSAGSLIYAADTNVGYTLLLVAAALSAVGLLACWIPARRAARISPSLALRGD